MPTSGSVNSTSAIIQLAVGSEPSKPMPTADQRRQPTFSPSTGPDSATTISG